jgi:hypothetical protein
MKNEHEYLIDSLALFHYDPPDSEYQEGYFDALAYMADYFGVIKIDPEERPKPSRPNLILIKGGKE